MISDRLGRLTVCGFSTAAVAGAAFVFTNATGTQIALLGLTAALATFTGLAVVSALTDMAPLSIEEDLPPGQTPDPPGRSPAPPTTTPELLEAILGSMFDGVAVVDSVQRVLYLNDAARQLLDLGGRDFAGRLLSEASRSSPLQDLIEKVLKTGSRHHTELVLTRQKLTLSVSASPLQVDSESDILIVLHDVTELRRLERMRREFVSNVSHELKTPLTSIQAYADTLLDGGLSDSEHNRRFLQRIVEQTERLQLLIQDLLRLARIESDDVALEIEPTDIHAIVKDCVHDRSAIAEAKGVQLLTELKEPVALVGAEEEGLRTILDNLVDNAINYTPSGGTVRISVTRSGGEICLAVADTGVGIPREHLPRVFERFYRVDRARSRELGGTGLGLSIVKHLVSAFGGRIELESELNQGSRFLIWLRPAPSPPDVD